MHRNPNIKYSAYLLKDTVQGLVWLFRYNRYGFLSMPILGGVRRTALKNASGESPRFRRVDLGHEMADKGEREKVK